MLDDDDDMADLYLSRKAGSASPVSGSGHANWFAASPTGGSKISRASRASIATMRLDENDVEELEMLLEVMTLFSSKNYLERIFLSFLIKKPDFTMFIFQAYFMQIDGTLNKLTTVSVISYVNLN